ncbi:fumarylacetoacetate hydrolase family protein [Porticoccaceae bacterium]|nr:fumarylacetoacetate hydrolase family protein [Porticoccaceae bacterium]CAI8255635.1 MAG: Homoprotocatechuate catabolism bifunctional isomerase/decarboxylase [SAR92 bacterium MED-G29]
MNYRHIIDGTEANLPIGKVVCVGRNYAAHAKELNNPVPSEPVLFIKPNTSLASLAESVLIPAHLGECHFEAEMSILIGTELSANCNEEQAQAAIAGVGIALDLTLRDLQQQLKDKSLPWEKAKAFDGACPVSGFVAVAKISDLQDQQIQLYQNDLLRQDGNSADMLTPVLTLLVYISQFFTLLPGDIVLTGTPAGVGPLAVGDNLTVSLSDLVSCQAQIIRRD